MTGKARAVRSVSPMAEYLVKLLLEPVSRRESIKMIPMFVFEQLAYEDTMEPCEIWTRIRTFYFSIF